MSAIIKEVLSRDDLKSFIMFPSRLHCDDPRWVPPLYRDEWRLHSKKRNPALAYCDTAFALAYKDGEVVGRIGCIINHRHNEMRQEKTARFGFIECVNENEVAAALLAFAEDWAIQNGMETIVGPMGFTDQHPEGLLIEGFDQEPSIGSYMNFEYLPRLIEANGFVKDVDYVVYTIPVVDTIPPVYELIYRRISRSHRFILQEFTNRRELKSYVKPILGLVNETFGELYGFVPMDEKEMDELAKAYLPVIDPRFVKVVSDQSGVVAFILGIPNMNSGFRRARGRLFPTGFLRILASARKSTRLDLLLGAIKPDVRGLGLDVLLGRAMLLSAREAGMKSIDTHHELETNTRVRSEMERVGGRIYKRFRIFKKELTRR